MLYCYMHEHFVSLCALYAMTIIIPALSKES